MEGKVKVGKVRFIPNVAAVFESKACVRLANRFHLVEECGPIEPTKQPNKEGDEK